MRMIFGVMSLLIVLAIVGTLGKTQLEAFGLAGRTTTRAVNQGAEAQAVTNAVMGRAGGLGGTGGAATIAVPGGMPGAEAAPVADGTVAGNARAVQQNVMQQTNKAIEQGIQRNNNALP